MQIKCKYCEFEGEAPLYAGFFPQEKISLAHERDPYMPKYGVHLGVDCPVCGRWQRWIAQTDETMLKGKFYLKDNQTKLL